MNARSICTAVICLLGAVACSDDTGSDTNAAEMDNASAGKKADSKGGSGGQAGKGGQGAKPAQAGKGGQGGGPASQGGKAGQGGSKATGGSKASPTQSNDKDHDAGAEAPAKPEPADYAKAENWLCRPDHNARCEQSLDTTIVKADGSTEVEKYQAKADPSIDCFYVYPTVSLDATPNSDLKPGDEEDSVVRAQFARFGTQCRLFAPMYRQVTLTALRANLAGTPSTQMPDREIGYNDVAAAFKYYLDHDNNGRAFVLVGHSQGSGVLTQLIKNELDKDPIDSRLLSAMLIGTNILVPDGKTVGGTFKHVPVCDHDDQLGCIETYASFRETTPPPDNSRFATSNDPSMVSACTNPAKGDGGSAGLHAYLNAQGPGLSSGKMGDWAKDLKVDTTFVSVPGLLSAECKRGKSGSYLSIKVNANPDDPRTDDIVGDVLSDGKVSADWGLHVIDVHLGMGNLLDLVKAKAAAYKPK